MLDSHCHLNDDALFSSRKDVIDRAISRGVTTFLCVGWDLESSKKAIDIAHEFPRVYAAVGIHPENIEGVPESALSDIKALARDPKVVAIGEIGLDYHWKKDDETKRMQKHWFASQLVLANELSLPVSIHARDAAADTLEVLKNQPLTRGGVLHCYSGSSELLPSFASLGFYFGFDGPITYRNSVVPKKNVTICPLDRLLSETDSPYLSPVPFRGQTNEPSHIPEIVKMMAILRGCDVKIIEEAINKNFERLFHVEL